MILLLALVVVWLAVLTAAYVGLNVRLAVLRTELARSRSNRAAADGESGGLGPATAALLVSETCGGCDPAIEALAAAASDDRRPGGFTAHVVLTPNPDDRRVQAPLRAVVDDELYRALYPGATPALVLTDWRGEPVVVRVVRDASDVRRLLEANDQLLQEETR